MSFPILKNVYIGTLKYFSKKKIVLSYITFKKETIFWTSQAPLEYRIEHACIISPKKLN